MVDSGAEKFPRGHSRYCGSGASCFAGSGGAHYLCRGAFDEFSGEKISGALVGSPSICPEIRKLDSGKTRKRSIATSVSSSFTYKH